MALQAVTADGVMTIPGPYGTFRVQTNPQGVATSGILVLMGEADRGPDYLSETSLAGTFFGPDEVGRAGAKYGSGPLVDAIRIAAQAANDPDIQGSPQGFYLIKTNAAGKAGVSLARAGLTAYGTLYDQSFGEPGNLISAVLTEAPAEIAPHVQSAYIPTGSGSSTLRLRVNGGGVQSLVATAATIPTNFSGNVIAGGPNTGLASLTDILGTGGIDRVALGGFANTDTLEVVATGNSVVITLAGAPTAWGTTPSVGDTLVIPLAGSYGCTQSSAIAGASNAGQYIVTAATATTITATKIHDAAVDTVTAPANFGPAAIGTEHTDILVYSPVVLKNVSGTTRAMLAAANVTATIGGIASGSTLTLTLSTGAWGVTPAINDYIYMPNTAPTAWIDGAGTDLNGGYYVVTAATATTVTLTRLSNGNPSTFAPTAIASVTDLVCKRPAIDGVGKSLEIYDGGNTTSVAKTLYTLGGAPVAWLSTQTAPVLNASDAELEIGLLTARSSQNITEDITAGGDVVMDVGYIGTTATLTIAGNTLSTTVVGGSGANLSINLKNYATVGDVAAYLNTQTGYTASPASNAMAQVKLYTASQNGFLVLDKGTFSIGTTHGNQTGRLKRDAWAWYDAVRQQSLLVQMSNPAAPATAGLPEAQILRFLSGGTRGATTDAGISAALTACEKLRANFVVPLFSRDALLDYADGLTDVASTYTVASINANVKTHVLRMSSFKAQRHRQGFVSMQDTFANCQDMASAMASFRVSLAFQAVRAIASDGSIHTMQPWALAVYAAAMQAAGFYRSIMAKGLNTSGVLGTDSSFDADNDTQVETALLAGMLVARARVGGGFAWVSDQTTYAVDSNFVYNSIQAVYDADLVVLTTSQRMGRAFVGQSLADVSAASAAGVFSAIMADLKRLKLLASSDDAPAGYKNAKFKVQGNVLYVDAEIKIANAIAFVPISFVVSEVTQTASA